MAYNTDRDFKDLAIDTTPVVTYKYNLINNLSNLVQAVFLISALVAAVSIVSGLMQASLINDVLNGRYITLAQAIANDDREALIGWIAFGVFLFSAIMFLIWVHRANKNLHSFKNPVLRFSPGWSVGWFFIPIMSLFRPYQVVNEISKASNPDIDPNLILLDSLPASPIVGLWWAFFLVSNWVGQIAFRYVLNDETVSDLLNATYAYIVSDAVDVVGFIITLIMVRKISQSQDKRYQKTVDLIKQEV